MASVRKQLPAFHYFQVGNGYTGSDGNRRYKIVTDKSGKKIAVYVYNGPLCFELTQERGEIRHTGEFELTPEGFEACLGWLEEQMAAAD